MSMFLTTFVEHGKANTHALAKIDTEIEEIEGTIKAERKKVPLVKGSTDNELTAVMTSDHYTDIELGLRYLVKGTLWPPTYELHASTNEYGQPSQTVSLLYHACVTQSTGEDWTNATLTLGITSLEGIAKKIPKLESFRVNVTSPNARGQLLARVRHISERSHTGRYPPEYVSVSRIDPRVYLQCQVKDTSDYMLLPVPVSIILDDNFVSKNTISVHPLNNTDSRRYQPSGTSVQATRTDDHPLKPSKGKSAEKIMMDLLRQHKLPGVEVDSSSRYPQPKCYPGTREDLLKRLVTWLKNPLRDSHLLWLWGSAGVGKTAVAQTIAEFCRDHEFGRQFGAGIFCSELSDEMAKERIIPTLVQQLADNCVPYKRYASQLLSHDRTILEMSIPAQFKKLIVEPFAHLQTSAELGLSAPLVIILDGMESFGETTLVLVIELVCEQVRTTMHNPLLWMISTRPESHLKSAFSRLSHRFKLVKEEVPSGDTQSQDDVFRYMESRLSVIHGQYWDVFQGKGPWPKAPHVQAIADSASGLFTVAESLLKFIEDPASGDPENQLVVHSDVAIHSLRWIGLSTRLNCPASDGSCCRPAALELMWGAKTEINSKRILKCLAKFSIIVCWKACLQAEQQDASAIVRESDQLIACRLKRPSYPDDYRLDFVKRVYGWRFMPEASYETVSMDEGDGVGASNTSLTKDILIGLIILGICIAQSILQ
ncbi:hypothetical protein AN958_12680 [Leucoagaricus sp. SymC.cos]|nr:hypothetical protein AN958_12680 [Leucoagaricus sp. SymC.cos]